MSRTLSSRNKRKSAKNAAIKYFNRFIVLRDHGVCVTCGSTVNPTCSHLISVTAGDTLRFDEENAHCQCRNCNFKHEYHPEDYMRWFINNYLLSLEAFEYLCDLKKEIVKYTEADYRRIAEEYKAKCEALEAR